MNRMTTARSSGGNSWARVAVLVTAVLQVLTPLLPSLGVGQPIGSQSDAVRTLITPAGWAFSIWGPLYAGALAFAVYQALPDQRTSALVAKLRWPAAGAFLGNAAWAAYTQLFGLTAISSVIIVFTLSCLLVAYRLFAGWNPVFRTGERWLAVLPLSALAAWVTAATIVNIAASLRYYGVGSGDAHAPIAAGIVIIGGLIAGAALTQGRGNPPYAIVFLWALAAIFAQGGQQFQLIALATGVAALLVLVGLAAGWRRNGFRQWFAR